MSRRRALMVAQKTPRLPDAYQEVEYITKPNASSTDVYLRTGKRINNIYPTVFKGKFYPTAFGLTTGSGMSTCIKHVSNSALPFGVNIKDGVGIRNGSSTATSYFVSMSTTNKIVEFAVTVTSEGFQLDGSIDGQPQTGIVQATPASWTANASDVLFLSSDYSGQSFAGRYYYAQVIQAGAPIIDLIPCYRKSDNKIGMYDLVSQTFMPVTGTWTKGADV